MMFDRDEEDESLGSFTRIAIRVMAVFAIGGIAITTGFYVIQPLWNDMATKATEQSYTFVQSKKELMVKLVQDYRKLETQQTLHHEEKDVVAALEAQKLATVDRLKSETSSVLPDQIPAEVVAFLKDH